MMIMEKTTMNFNKMSMDSDLHSERLIEAITLIKNNGLFFCVEKDFARDILDSNWNEYTYRDVLSVLRKCSFYNYIKNASLIYILNDEEFLQEESENLIELGEEIKDFISTNGGLNF